MSLDPYRVVLPTFVNREDEYHCVETESSKVYKRQKGKNKQKQFFNLKHRLENLYVQTRAQTGRNVPIG